jgi:uncharacterized Fe-S center protein
MPQNTVFFHRLSKNSTLRERTAGMRALLSDMKLPACFAAGDKVAVKIHVGERRNTTFVKPEIIRQVVRWIKSGRGIPFLTETSTLYKGARSHAVDHLIHAFNHGFTYGKTGAPFIMADGLLGNSEIRVDIPGQIFKSVLIAREVLAADALVAVSHATGHMACGIGACIKNLGMGLASRMGKMRQHSTIKPYIKTAACTMCGACIKWCPENTIIKQEGKAFIVQENCTGCGECLAVCGFDAVAYNWSVESTELQKRMAEHACGVLMHKKNKCLFINVLADMTKDCDCIGSPQQTVIPDVGLLASLDPVAVDQATLDLTAQADGSDLARISYPGIKAGAQLAHAESIGMGCRVYELRELG